MTETKERCSARLQYQGELRQCERDAHPLIEDHEFSDPAGAEHKVRWENLSSEGERPRVYDPRRPYLRWNQPDQQQQPRRQRGPI